MYIYKTVDSNNFIRLEEESGAAVTIYQTGDIGLILSLLVPRSDRDEGIGTALLKAAEVEAEAHGIKSLEADYSSKIKGMSELFESCGYETRESYPIISIDMAEILGSERVKKVVKKNTAGVRFESLEELLMMQWDQLIEILDRFSIRLSSSDLGHFSQSASGVVYDASDEPKAFVLSSELDDSFHVDFLAAPGGDGSFVMAALQGMLLEIIAKGGATKFKRLTAISANKSISRLLENLLGSDHLQQVAAVMYAKRNVDPDENVDILEDFSEGAEEEFRREVRGVEFQGNIVWKPAWYRGRRDKTEVKEDKAGDGSDTGQKVESDAGLGSKDTAKALDFPEEYMSPYDMVFDYDKDEDETYGLIHEGMVRICEDNLEDFEEILPVDALYNMPRPYFRGLATGSDEDSSYIIYELKDLDDDLDVRSQIFWMNFADQDEGESLISEYLHEVGEVDAVESFFETGPDKLTKSVFGASDFDVSEKESKYLHVTLKELQTIPFIKGKVPEHVTGLDEIGERQFKRGVGNCLLNNKKGVLEDLAYLPMDWFEKDVSSCIFVDKKVTGMLLVHQLPSHRLFVDLLFSGGGDSQLEIMLMIRRSIQAALKKYPQDTQVILYRHNKMVEKLANRLFPGKKGDKVLAGLRKH